MGAARWSATRHRRRLWATDPATPDDVFVIASNSGVNGSIVGLALRPRSTATVYRGDQPRPHRRVDPKHPSGKRLTEVADVVIDNLAPYGDATLTPAADVAVGAVSSITAAFIAQLLTIGVSERSPPRAAVPPLYLSANIPGGDDHNLSSRTSTATGCAQRLSHHHPRKEPPE